MVVDTLPADYPFFGLRFERIFITVRCAFIKQKSWRAQPPTGGGPNRSGNEAGSLFLHVDIVACIL
jgi:hypothetical protein